MLEKLFNDIRLIYEGLNYSEKLLINDLMIVSQDNYYLLYYKPDDVTTQIRIEKHFSLVNMWSDNKELDITYYNIHVEVGGEVYTISENSMVELTYKIITPFLRDLKLDQIGLC